MRLPCGVLLVMLTSHTHPCVRPRSLAALLLGLVLLLPTDSQAHTLVGAVLEEGRETPIAGATVSLGYAATSSPLFAMTLEGSVPFVLM